MALYRVTHKPSVEKDFKSIPDIDKKEIVKNIQDLATNPRPFGCKKLSGQNKYRIRHGDYRILYTIDDNGLTVRVMKIGHRKDIYRVSEEKARFTADGLKTKNKK